jgi:hypothetical protein
MLFCSGINLAHLLGFSCSNEKGFLKISLDSFKRQYKPNPPHQTAKSLKIENSGTILNAED